MTSVIVDGPHEGFKSNSAFDKFKKYVKTKDTETKNLLKFIKEDYELLLLSKTDETIQFIISKKKVEVHPTLKKIDALKAKIKLMKENRTNSVMKNLSLNKDKVPQEIIDVYTLLKKQTHMPIPEPLEILTHPEEHKELVKMALQNPYMHKLPESHPYVQYFRLLAKHMNIDIPKVNIQELKSVPKNEEKLSIIEDDDTDSESKSN